MKEKGFEELTENEIGQMQRDSVELVIELLKKNNVRGGSENGFSLYTAIQRAIESEWLTAKAIAAGEDVSKLKYVVKVSHNAWGPETWCGLVVQTEEHIGEIAAFRKKDEAVKVAKDINRLSEMLSADYGTFIPPAAITESQVCELVVVEQINLETAMSESEDTEPELKQGGNYQDNHI